MGTDLKSAVRSLLKSRSFTGIAILSLAIGIGGNTAIFSVVHAVLLRPLPYPDAHRIVRLSAYNPLMEISRSNVSGPDLESWRAESHAFETLAAFSTFSTSFRGDTEAERVEGASVSADFFKVLGVSPDVGRAFTAEETRVGAAPAVVASRSLRRYHDMGVRMALGARPADVFGLIVGQGARHRRGRCRGRAWGIARCGTRARRTLVRR
ncbi:MAG: ABC transporter permease [Acidobacteria bacterium]|nr:ABC transporter permease [Acidobacteriota bacterium]MCA1649048.1 ABC transporter permease [Acidobacteriota bacterium]